MIKISKTDVHGFEAAIRGMRNPKNSWDKSDSAFSVYTGECSIGPNDEKLMRTLANAGDDHGKFLRMINVSCDIEAPVYWVAELDTYKVGTVRDSCSMMHKGTSRHFVPEDFSLLSDCDNDTGESVDSIADYTATMALCIAISSMNTLVDRYNETKSEAVFSLLRAITPMGYNYRFTWQANYQVLRHIYHARKTHRLKEWRDFCEWIESLPYSWMITGNNNLHSR